MAVLHCNHRVEQLGERLYDPQSLNVYYLTLYKKVCQFLA